MAIRGSEERAARRLTNRLPLSAADRQVLMRRHRGAVGEIVDAALLRRDGGWPTEPPSRPARAFATVARSPRRAVTRVMHTHAWPLRGWITWLGKRWSGGLARFLQIWHRP